MTWTIWTRPAILQLCRGTSALLFGHSPIASDIHPILVNGPVTNPMRTPPATAIPEREGTTFSRAASLILDDAGAGSAPADAPAKPIKRAIYTEQAPIPSALPSQGSHRPLAGTPFPDAVSSAESTPEASVNGNVIQAQAADNRAESVYGIAQASEAVSPSASAAVSVPVSRKKRALYSTESCPTPRSSPTVSDDFSGPSSHPTTDPPARPVLDSAPLQAIEGEQNPATVRDVPIATPAPAQRKKRAVYTQSASLESTPKPSATFATVQPAPASQVARNSAYAAASKSATMPSVSTSPPQARLAFDRASSIGSSSSAPISAPVPAKRVKRAIYTQSPSVHSSPLPSPGLSSVAPTAGSRVQQGRAHAHTSSATVDHGGREDQSPPLDRSATDASWSDVNGFSARMRYDTDQRPSSSVVDRARDGYNASRRQEGQRGNAARRGDGSDDSSTWTDVATGRRSFGSPDPGQSRNYTKAGSRTERAPAFSLGATVKLEPIDATVSWVETSRISRQPSWQNIPYVRPDSQRSSAT